MRRPYSRLEREDGRAEPLSSTESQLEEHFKQQHHISWNEAWRAEKEREKARLTSCNKIPTAGPLTLFAVNIASELPSIKSRASRYFSWIALKSRSGRSVWQRPVRVRGEKGDRYIILDASAEIGSAEKSTGPESTQPRNH